MCSFSSDCHGYGDEYQVCVDNLCQCRSNFNYKLDSTHQECDYFFCKSDGDCEDYDKNRICREECICSTDFVEEYDTKKCIGMKTKNCTSYNDCDQNQFCINNQCRCQPNYQYSAETEKCEYHLCQYRDDCNQHDSNSECFNDGSCRCDSSYVLDPKTKICSTTVSKSC